MQKAFRRVVSQWAGAWRVMFRAVGPQRVICLLVVCAVTGTNARAQRSPWEFSLGGFVGGALADAAENARAAAREKRLAEMDFQAARDRFWSQYPNGSGLEKARAELAALLRDKDIYYLNLTLADRIGGAGSTLDQITGGALDGGISVWQRPLFTTWADAVFASASSRVAGVPVLTREALTSAASMAAYRAYIEVRDLDELYRGPFSPLNATDPTAFLTAMLVRCRTWPSVARAKAEYDAIVDVLGEPATRNAATVLRGAIDREDCSLPDPTAVGLTRLPGGGRVSGFTYLASLADKLYQTTGDDRKRLIVALRPGVDFLQGRQRYDSLVVRFGEERVREFGAAQRTVAPAARCTAATYPRCIDAYFGTAPAASGGDGRASPPVRPRPGSVPVRPSPGSRPDSARAPAPTRRPH